MPRLRHRQKPVPLIRRWGKGFHVPESGVCVVIAKLTADDMNPAAFERSSSVFQVFAKYRLSGIEAAVDDGVDELAVRLCRVRQ